MLLRQTRASNVSGIWDDFVGRYPTAKILARAKKGTLIRHLKILGSVTNVLKH